MKLVLVLVAVALATASCATLSMRERLRDPMRIVRVQHDGITLDNGVKVMPRGLDHLPVANDAFRLALRWSPGAELTAEGDVIVLVNLPATCGNDPVDELIARVSVKELVAFAEDGSIDRRDLFLAPAPEDVAGAP